MNFYHLRHQLLSEAETQIYTRGPRTCTGFILACRDLASDPSARLFGWAIVIRDGQINNHFEPFYNIFGHFRQFWMGTSVHKNGQFQNVS